MRAVDFTWIRDLMAEHAAISLEPSKRYLVEARLPQVARAHGFRTIDEMVVSARTHRRMDLRLAIVDALTTNETSFFRDHACWSALRDDVLPELIGNRRSSRTLRVWSAACSTGQEPYTIAMLLREDFPELADWTVDILATDVSRRVLEQARTGEFGVFELDRGLSPAMRRRYFTPVEGGRGRVAESLRQWVHFQQLNLGGPWPAMPTFDLILVRNVLIYFDASTKQRILSRAEGHLAGDGFLLMGSGESTLNLDLSLRRQQRRQAWFYQLG